VNDTTYLTDAQVREALADYLEKHYGGQKVRVEAYSLPPKLNGTMSVISSPIETDPDPHTPIEAEILTHQQPSDIPDYTEEIVKSGWGISNHG
jgi:hypothetical protein